MQGAQMMAYDKRVMRVSEFLRERCWGAYLGERKKEKEREREIPNDFKKEEKANGA